MRRFPAVALGVLAMVDGLHVHAFLVLGPDIARTLGVGVGTIAAIAVLSSVAASVAALPEAAVVRSGRHRGALCTGAGVAWVVASGGTALATSPWTVAALTVADGASTASVRAVHPAFIADLYDEAARVRALALHQALDVAGVVVAPLLVAGLSAAGFTWRGVFIAAAVVSLLATVVAAGVRDPGIRAIGGGEPRPLEAGSPAAPTVAEQARALLVVPTIRRLLIAGAVTGVFLAPLLSFLFFFLEGRWGLDAGQRGVFFATMGGVAVLAVALVGPEADRRLGRGPAALIDGLWPLLLLAAAGLLAAVLAPAFSVVVAGCCLAFACLPLLRLGVNALLVTLAPPGERVVATALAGVAASGVGGLGGLLLLSALREALGLTWAMGTLAVPALAAAIVLRSAREHAAADLARMLAAESTATRPHAAAGSVLEARGLVFDYGPRRVLDGVDLTVDEGEALAVLGTNGAGKSTLLRVLCGLAPPLGGRVWLSGHDITHLEPERRAALGMAYVASSGATFGSLTTTEALRLAARAAGHRTSADPAVAEVLERFPVLNGRPDVAAVALSEGERRLLSLAQALLLRPRILLVDELSRGLSPVATQAALQAVGDLGNDGTAIVLVEQSLDVAATVAPRSCFLERGRMRFDGRTEDLRARADLLRPVFLGTVEGTPTWTHEAASP